MNTTSVDVVDSHTPLVPIDIIRHSNRNAARLYTEIAIIAHAAGDDTFYLPPWEEMCKLCDFSKPILISAYSALEESGYLTIHNKNAPGPTRKKFVTLRMIEPAIVNRVVVRQGISDKTVYRAKRGPDGNGELDIILNPPQIPLHISAAKSVCSNKDRSGKTLNAVSDVVLWDMSGRAPFDELYLAIREVESYKPKGGKQIENIFSVFLARFDFDREGNGRLKANRVRKKKFVVHHSVGDVKAVHSKNPYQQHARELGASIYPDDFHDEKSVDRFCKLLNERNSVERGETPQSIRDIWTRGLGVIVSHHVESNNRLCLEEAYELERIKPGYWKAVPVTLTVSKAGRQCHPQSHTRRIGDGLQSLVRDLPVPSKELLENLSS